MCELLGCRDGFCVGKVWLGLNVHERNTDCTRPSELVWFRVFGFGHDSQLFITGRAPVVSWSATSRTRLIQNLLGIGNDSQFFITGRAKVAAWSAAVVMQFMFDAARSPWG